MKEKLLIVSWYGMNNVGGLERVTQYMYKAWKEKYDVIIVDKKYIEKTFKWIKLLTGKHYLIDSFVMSFCVNKICKQYKKKHIPCKCITQGYNAPFVKADLAFAHGTMRGFKIALEGKNTKWKFNQFFEKISYTNSRRVITVAQHVKNEVHQLYKIPLAKIHTVENCVDTDFFTPDFSKARSYKYNILFVGRLELSKGLKKLLKLAQQIEKCVDFELYIATPDLQNVELFKNFTHTTVRHGLNKNEMKCFYQNGDLMFFPSIYEGFGMITIECLSCGAPVIGNKIGAIGDLFEKNLEGVYLLPETDEINLEFLSLICKKFREPNNKLILHSNMERFYSEKVYKKRLQKLL